MNCQNCNVCEYKNLKTEDTEDCFCYMFKDKPEGKCGQFKPEKPKEYQALRKGLGAWAKFL